jgi:aspartyl-tRNA(Asn)/glutamyl-tRNA(Gln) amidotransferase subunit A
MTSHNQSAETWETISVLAQNVESGKTTAIELVNKSLRIIKNNQGYNAIIALTEKRALQRAQAIDESVKKGNKIGKLAGVPFIAKDNFLCYGADTTAASNILKGFKAPYQSTAIERLEAEGAICVAKANLDAFAHGSSTENSDFMTTKNPHDQSRVPGGSSGGSAAAVMLDMAPFALGTDTGGSIRLPAAFCGAVGYKPSYGLVSRSGVIAMASSTDVIGPLTKNVEDAALVLECMAGKDALDSTTIERDVNSYSDLEVTIEGKTFGLVKEYMDEGLSKDVRKSVESAIKKIQDAGGKVEEISMPSSSLALACYYIICPAEVSSNLSRYDGQRYGYSDEDAHNIEESYIETRTKGFGREAKRRILIGTYVLSSGYYDAYYKKGQQLRTKLIEEFNQSLKDYDYLIGPTAPTTAFKIGAHSKDPLEMYMSDVMTVAANLVGVPAISIPIEPAEGLPVGLQIIAPQNNDRSLLGVSKAIEEQYS